MFTERYGKGNKIGQQTKGPTEGRGKREEPQVKPLREESLKGKKDTKINKMLYLVHFLCLTPFFSDVCFVTSYRIQTYRHTLL